MARQYDLNRWAVPTLRSVFMPQYRRARIPGGTYFFTVVTHARQPFLTHPLCRTILANVIREVQLAHSFSLEAWVSLPDHWHCVWTLPEGDADYSKRWGLIKAKFSKQTRSFLCPTGDCSNGDSRKREAAIWQRRFWEHVIRDDADFRIHLDYIHYNPVKHGLVDRVQDWPYSSFHRFVAQGMYPIDWGEQVDLAESHAFGE